MSEERIVIVDGARTPVGKYAGALKSVPAHELGAIASLAALERSGIGKDQIDEVIFGCTGQVGPDAYNARRVALAAGLPDSTPAFTVNRLCGSGLQAIWSAAQQLRWGGAEVILAGGDESMSRIPFLDFEARGNPRLGNRTLVDGTVSILTDPFIDMHMGFTAENVAAKYDISRQAQDEFALQSQTRAATAEAQAAFAEEITPVQISGRHPSTVLLDEHPRPEVTLESLAGLRPAFQPDGTVTAGNSSGVNDGAGAVVVMKESTVRERGMRGLVTLEYVATAGIDPALMGFAPALALRKLFQETGLTPADIGVVELNEAFAAQSVAVIRDAKLDPDKTNPHGGAIALGHPLGATGAILTLRAAKDMQRRGLQYGIVSMCIGGGQALAALLKRYDA
ncbi:MAG TPA: thiolase family protein [Dermatophilaceae bacterium]